MNAKKEPPTVTTAHLRGTAAAPDWPPREGWHEDDDWRRRAELFNRLFESWRKETELAASDARSFVEAHLRAALPLGWVANYRVARNAQHLPGTELGILQYEWRIFREGEPPDDEYFEHYLAFLNARNQMVLVYGNTDAGVGGPHQFWERSISIPLTNLGLVLPFVFARPHEFPPNRFGLT